jgi:hypothetical protein
MSDSVCNSKIRFLSCFIFCTPHIHYVSSIVYLDIPLFSRRRWVRRNRSWLSFAFFIVKTIESVEVFVRCRFLLAWKSRQEAGVQLFFFHRQIVPYYISIAFIKIDEKVLVSLSAYSRPGKVKCLVRLQRGALRFSPLAGSHHLWNYA